MLITAIDRQGRVHVHKNKYVGLTCTRGLSGVVNNNERGDQYLL